MTDLRQAVVTHNHALVYKKLPQNTVQNQISITGPHEHTALIKPFGGVFELNRFKIQWVHIHIFGRPWKNPVTQAVLIPTEEQKPYQACYKSNREKIWKRNKSWHTNTAAPIWWCGSGTKHLMCWGRTHTAPNAVSLYNNLLVWPTSIYKNA